MPSRLCQVSLTKWLTSGSNGHLVYGVTSLAGGKRRLAPPLSHTVGQGWVGSEHDIRRIR